MLAPLHQVPFWSDIVAAAEFLKQKVFEAIKSLADDSVVISDATALLGDERVLDSMKLVELCLLLEDVASENDFSFDWTSESAMSRSRSMFRTAGTLAEAFVAQSVKPP